MIACTPEESQNDVDVMSATIAPTPGDKTETSCWQTSSELVTSISAGSTTTTDMICPG